MVLGNDLIQVIPFVIGVTVQVQAKNPPDVNREVLFVYFEIGHPRVIPILGEMLANALDSSACLLEK